MLPLMLLYMSNSNSLQYLSSRITAWQQKALSPVKALQPELKISGNKGKVVKAKGRNVR
jgi:hypothetical protein